MGLLGKREVEFELIDTVGVGATLVYYAIEYPEGLGIDIDHIYFGYNKNKIDMSFLLENKKFYEWMEELANEDFDENT